MLGMDQRAARVTWTVFLVLLIILLAYLARHTIIVFLVALFFAYMLSPAVNAVQRLIPERVSRNWSLAIVYLVFIGALVGIGFGLGSTIAQQASNLANRLPDLIKSNEPLRGWLPQWLDPMRERIVEAIRAQMADLEQSAIPLLKTAAEEIFKHAGTVLEIVLVPILSFFFLKDGARIRETIVSWTTTGSNTVLFDEILDDVHLLLGRYIRALVILAFATFVFYTLFLQLTGGQYSVLLGGIAGVFEFVPVVGPLAAAVLIVVVEGFTGYSHVIGFIIFILCYRMFQDYVLSPYLMGAGVELHPLLVLFGVFAGEQIAGIPGMFFSVPILAILRVVYVRLMRARAARKMSSREELELGPHA
jgi:predicted PurR-regulated permease PerM